MVRMLPTKGTSWHLPGAQHADGGDPRAVKQPQAGQTTLCEDGMHGRSDGPSVMLHVRLQGVQRQQQRRLHAASGKAGQGSVTRISRERVRCTSPAGRDMHALLLCMHRIRVH